jgi:hypothetical protein
MLSLLCMVVVMGVAAAAAAPKPNIIYMLTDNLGYGNVSLDGTDTSVV